MAKKDLIIFFLVTALMFASVWIVSAPACYTGKDIDGILAARLQDGQP